MGIEIDQLLLGRFGVFCYLVTELCSREAMVVDPGAEPDRILSQIRKREAQVRWIVCTHAHPDHVGAVTGIKSETGAPVALHRKEARTMGRLSHRLLTRLMGGKPPPKPDLLVEDGDVLQIGCCKVNILHTPGHSPGGICLLAEGNLFSGDTLFVDGVGRTDLPGASWGQLCASLRQKVLCLPGGTRLWPGHHYGSLPTRQLEEERRMNPFLREILAVQGQDSERSVSEVR